MPTRPHTSDSPCGLKLRGINHTPRKYCIKKVKPGSSSLLHLRKGGRGESDSTKNSVTFTQGKAQDARKLRSLGKACCSQ